LGPDDHAFSDAHNHASIIDGLRLTRATRTILPHLHPPPSTTDTGVDATPLALRWWIVESIFSMDGDGPPDTALTDHARQHALYLDEAHALGLFKGGSGRAGDRLRPQVLVGTLGKALGCAGAFAGGSKLVCDHLRGHARGFVFTTGPSPATLPAVLRAIECVRGREGERRRQRLRERVRQLRTRLGLSDRPSFSPIVPIIIGDNQGALAISNALLEQGFHVQAIRPPTVPEGTARLRLTVTSEHEPAHIDALARALQRTLADHGLSAATTPPV
jgi:7-keto-8-aminopelargonate synthetase-like enzyme